MLDIVKSCITPNGLTVRIAGSAEDPLFLLADLAGALDIVNPHTSVVKFPAWMKVTKTMQTNRGPQPCTYLTEAGMFSVASMTYSSFR
jgi:prophage antirepressor-like protein